MSDSIYPAPSSSVGVVTGIVIASAYSNVSNSPLDEPDEITPGRQYAFTMSKGDSVTFWIFLVDGSDYHTVQPDAAYVLSGEPHFGSADSFTLTTPAMSWETGCINTAPAPGVPTVAQNFTVNATDVGFVTITISAGNASATLDIQVTAS